MGEVGSRVCVGGRFCFGGIWWGGDGIGVLDMDGCWVETVGRGRLGVGLGWVGGMGIGVGDGIGVGWEMVVSTWWLLKGFFFCK